MVEDQSTANLKKAAAHEATDIAEEPDRFTAAAIQVDDLTRASKASLRAVESQAALQKALESKIVWLEKDHEHQRQVILSLQAQTKELSETKAELEKLRSPLKLRNKLLHGSSIMEGLGAIIFVAYPFSGEYYLGEQRAYIMYGLGLGDINST